MSPPCAAAPPYPVRLYGRLDDSVSRWLWLVKWLLLIPHLFVLLFLWITLAVLTLVSWVAVVTIARYPGWIFEFNVGVLRWTWRVAYYGYAALGTDRYPPFTLADVPDYPARLEIDYPQRLSRALALVKWWLLALPHYLLLGIFVGGSVELWQGEHLVLRFGGGLITVLVLIVAVALLFTGRYPAGIFALVMGLNRWVWRVAAYALLLTDHYPPFRLDQGGTDDGPIPPRRSPGDLQLATPPDRDR